MFRHTSSSSRHRHHEPEDGEVVDESVHLPPKPTADKWSNSRASPSRISRSQTGSSSRLPAPVESYRPKSLSPNKPTASRPRSKEREHNRVYESDTHESRSRRYDDKYDGARRAVYHRRERSPPRYNPDWGAYNSKRIEMFKSTSPLNWDGIRDGDRRRIDDERYRSGEPRRDERREERREVRREREERDRRYDKGDDRRRSGHKRFPPSSPRGEHRRHRYHSPRRRTRSPSPQVEDGEIESSEVDTRLDTSLDVPERPPSPDIPPPSSSPEKPMEHKRRRLIRHTRLHTPEYPAPPAMPADDPPPPPPPDHSPPPRPPTPPLSVPDVNIQTPNGNTPVELHARDGTNGDTAKPLQKPVNRALQVTKERSRHKDRVIDARSDGDLPAPDAPNRNLLQPPTRPSTPSGKTDLVQVDHVPKSFRRPTREQELRKLQKEFRGTASLTAYDVGLKLGEGTFGVVTKGVEIATKRAIALKKLITHNVRDGVSMTTVREIKILKSLHHKNVVPIIDMVVQPKGSGDRTGRQEIFMVFPYADHDLCGLLGNDAFKPGHSLVKLMMKQILEGMAYIHANNFVHRDIKTANILVDRSGVVMIADFGLARSLSSEELPPHMVNEYTNMVVTRWYRAPELLLGDTHYGPAVDMWSLGCVLGEIYNKDPILMGESDRDQVYRIFAHCGPLNQDSFPGWDLLPGFPEASGHPWDKTPQETPIIELAQKWNRGKMDRSGADLLAKLLTLDPQKRITATDALDHPWFWIAPKTASVKDGLIPLDPSHEFNSGRRRHEPAAPAPQPQVQRNQLPTYGQQRPQPSHLAGWAGQNHHPPPFTNGMGRPPQAAYGNYPPQALNGYQPGPSSYNNRPAYQSHLNANPLQPVRPFPPASLPSGPRLGVPPPPFPLAGTGIRPNIPPPPFALAGQSFRPPTGPSGNRRGLPVFTDEIAREDQLRRADGDGLPYG